MKEADIYTHGDFDGIVSGAILYQFCIDQGLAVNSIQFVNYNTHPKDSWHMYPFDTTRLNLVSDYYFSDNLITTEYFIWADHHERGDYDFSQVQNGTIIYDPKAPSCAGLLTSLLKEESFLHEAIKWADIVDSARYRDAKQAVLMNESPYLVLAAASSQNFSDSEFRVKTLINLATQPIEVIIKDPKIKDDYRRFCWKQKSAVDYLGKNLIVTENKPKIGVCSYVGCKFSSRYAPFLVNPDLEFLIQIRKIPPWNQEIVGISVSYNPWKEPEVPLALNEIISECTEDGGGHERVSAATLPNLTAAIDVSHRMIELMELKTIRGGK